jgi:hypothetical protein
VESTKGVKSYQHKRTKYPNTKAENYKKITELENSNEGKYLLLVIGSAMISENASINTLIFF